MLCGGWHRFDNLFRQYIASRLKGGPDLLSSTLATQSLSTKGPLFPVPITLLTLLIYAVEGGLHFTSFIIDIATFRIAPSPGHLQ